MYLFNAKIEDPEKLEQMLVGREQIVNVLVEAQLKHSKNGLPPQFLVVGPRGSGKTHMLRVIYERLLRNGDYIAMHDIAYMVEDETGIGSYFDLLQRILEAIKRWSNDAQKTNYIIEQIDKLKDTQPKEWTRSTENILISLLNNKSLLILIENFDAIMRGMDKKYAVMELSRLRDFIQQHNQLSFIATSQSLIHSLSDNQNPLYGFFNIIQLKRLTLEESFDYIKKIALSENNEELVQFLETPDGKGHLEAIHQFTKGNHRLLLVFFDFLRAEFRSNLSDIFLKSIDELKPYYDSFLKSLSPQQQKIVQYLSLQRNPQKGADIGRNCFLDKSTVSKQLSELQRLGFINPVNEKGRDKYYEISEPLLRLCVEIGEDRNGIIKLFVNFLGQLYSKELLRAKFLYYNYMGQYQPEPVRKLYQEEAEIYSFVKSQYLNLWMAGEAENSGFNMVGEPSEIINLDQERSYQNQELSKFWLLNNAFDILFKAIENKSKIEIEWYKLGIEDALMVLVNYKKEDMVKDIFNKLLTTCRANNELEQLSALFSIVVFRIIRERKDIKPLRLELTGQIFEDLFTGIPEFSCPLRYFDIGFRYFVKAEKEAIYEMSQEERKIFENFTNTEAKY